MPLEDSWFNANLLKAARAYVREQKRVHSDIGEVFQITIKLSTDDVELHPVERCDIIDVDDYDQ